MLSLGHTPLANALLSEADLTRPEPRYPLDVVFCTSCSLVQITATVPPESLFREYLYFSSFSDTALEHARLLAEQVASTRALDGTSRVIEIASNDGYLLQHYAAQRGDFRFRPQSRLSRRRSQSPPSLQRGFGLDNRCRSHPECHRPPRSPF